MTQMKNEILITLLFFLLFQSYGQSNTSFSKEEIRADLDVLRESLQEAHYNLYAYTTAQEFEAAYQRAKGEINQDSISLLETTNIFQRFISVINTGHTEIDFPGQSYREYAYAGGTVFPLEIAFEGDKALIRKNWSGNDSLVLSAEEILKINGKPISEIMGKIYPQLSAERPYLKNAKIEMYSFPRLYWQVFGKQENFEVEIKINGRIKKYSLEGADLIEDYETKRNEVLNAQMKLKFYDNTAYLNPGDFSGDQEKYQHFVDSAFVEISDKNSDNLVIDLRNNAGGDNSFSDYLISYFADKPFTWNSRFTLKTSQLLKEHTRKNNDTTLVYFREILERDNDEIFPYEFDKYQPQLKDKRFVGNVYVLVNRQSYSQSAVTAAQIQDYKLGIIVGEETGDYPSLYASQFQYTLPNTGIPVKIAKGYIIRVNGSTKEQGVIPDILIKDHLLDEKDEILEGILEQIN